MQQQEPEPLRANEGRGGARRDGRAASMISAKQWESVRTELGLSNQQFRIVKLLFQGKNDKQIASALKVSVATVRTHLSRLFNRTGAGDRVELLLLAFAIILKVRGGCHQE